MRRQEELDVAIPLYLGERLDELTLGTGIKVDLRLLDGDSGTIPG